LYCNETVFRCVVEFLSILMIEELSLIKFPLFFIYSTAVILCAICSQPFFCVTLVFPPSSKCLCADSRLWESFLFLLQGITTLLIFSWPFISPPCCIISFASAFQMLLIQLSIESISCHFQFVAMVAVVAILLIISKRLHLACLLMHHLFLHTTMMAHGPNSKTKVKVFFFLFFLLGRN
jgi:hypothetical protein